MRVLFGGLALLLCGVVTASASASVVRLPDQLEWKARPFSPYPTAILFGDPTKPGLYVIRIKLPAGLKVLPHFHPDEWRTAAVLSGTVYFGFGEKWDETKLEAYPAGTFFTEPKAVAHFAWAKDGEVIIQFTGIGPTDSTMLPQN